MIQWRTSSYSAGNGACVQMGFRKSSYSADNGACVEVSTCACHGVPIRDSKDPDGPVLVFTQGEWAAFLLGIKDGEFDYTGG